MPRHIHYHTYILHTSNLLFFYNQVKIYQHALKINKTWNYFLLREEQLQQGRQYRQCAVSAPAFLCAAQQITAGIHSEVKWCLHQS